MTESTERESQQGMTDTPASTLLERSWEWTLAFGLFMTLAGIIGISFAVWTTLASVVFFGALLMAGGIIYAIEAFRGEDHRKGSRLEQSLLATLYLVMAIAIFIDPVSASAAMTLILTGFFIFTGVMRLFYAVQRKDKKHGAVWAHVLAGLLNIALAAVIIWQWPISSLVFIGIFVSLELMFGGWILVFAALGLRKLVSTTDKHSSEKNA